MRSVDHALAARLHDGLAEYERDVGELRGIRAPARRNSLVEQMVESDRRTRFLRHIADAEHSSVWQDPHSGKFDPLRAAVLRYRSGDIDEALWLLFLAVYFGKHRIAAWRYATATYGRLAGPGRWDWQAVAHDVPAFRDWIDANVSKVKGPRPHGFGNHRKYESLNGWSDIGTGDTVASYVDWVGPSRTHTTNLDAATAAGGGEPTAMFGVLYCSMDAIHRFGRTARFDFLSLAGRLGVVAVRPGRAYLTGATGPVAGARLLFGEAKGKGAPPSALDDCLVHLEPYLSIGFDALEDALCNWQKSPLAFKPFRG